MVTILFFFFFFHISSRFIFLLRISERGVFSLVAIETPLRRRANARVEDGQTQASSCRRQAVGTEHDQVKLDSSDGHKQIKPSSRDGHKQIKLGSRIGHKQGNSGNE